MGRGSKERGGERKGLFSKEGKGRAGEGGEGREGVRRGGKGRGAEALGPAPPPTHNFWVRHWLTHLVLMWC